MFSAKVTMLTNIAKIEQGERVRDLGYLHNCSHATAISLPHRTKSPLPSKIPKFNCYIALCNFPHVKPNLVIRTSSEDHKIHSINYKSINNEHDRRTHSQLESYPHCSPLSVKFIKDQRRTKGHSHTKKRMSKFAFSYGNRIDKRCLPSILEAYK